MKFPPAHRVSAASLLAVISLAATACVHAGHPIQIEDLTGARAFQIQAASAAVFAPDGESLASVSCDPKRITAVDDTRISDQSRSSPDAPYASVGCDIWIHSVVDDSKRNLTNAIGSNWSPSWSPDGSLLAFHSDRDGVPRVWVWERATDTIRRVSDLPTRQTRGYEFPLWLGAHQILVKRVPEGAQQGWHGAVNTLFAAPASEKEEGSTVSVFVSPAPEVSTAATSRELVREGSEARRADFAILDVRSGKTVRTYEGGESYAYRLSPDRRFLAFFDQERGAVATDTSSRLKLLSLASGATEVIASGIRQSFAGAISWSPDSRRLVYASIDTLARDRARGARKDTTLGNEGADLFVVDVDGRGKRQPRRVAGEPNLFLSDYAAPLWAEDGAFVYAIGVDNQVWKIDSGRLSARQLTSDVERKTLLLVANATGHVIASTDAGRTLLVTTRHRTNHRSGFRQVDTVGGQGRQLREEAESHGGIFDPPVLSPRRHHLAYAAQGSAHGEDVWLADTTFAQLRRLSTLNPKFDDQVFGESRVLDFQRADGTPLQAALVLPADYQPGKRYPLVLWVYASNADAARNANRFGLVGFQSFNMHMLTTRGYAVMWPDIPTGEGTPVDDLVDAVMPAIDKAVELGIVDPQRLAVMGNSNGGYSTLALITRTDRFKAAVMNAGFGDLTAFHGTMGGAWIPWLERLGGSMGVPPWEAPQRYIENSPIYALDRISTPLIIQAGTADLSIIQHSDQVWVEMQRLSKRATYLRYGGEGHLLAGAANLRDYWGRVLNFFEKELAPTANHASD